MAAPTPEPSQTQAIPPSVPPTDGTILQPPSSPPIDHTLLQPPSAPPPDHTLLQPPSARPTDRTAVESFPSDGGTIAQAPRSPSALAAGLQAVHVPGYEVLGELGRGGMGVVYKARQVGLNRLVALKMILSGDYAAAGDLARFRLEAEAVAKFQHPNIVQIYDIDEVKGLPYFCLEFVDGGPLHKKLAGDPQPPRQAAELLRQLAAAMEYAHQRKIVHRDLKPANVLLAADGTPKIADFGLAKKLDDAESRTQSGSILGTPSYMAPEQARGVEVGPSADVYSLGAILYETLVGRPPFKGATVLDTLEQVRSQEPVPPSRLQPKVPRNLETICLKCLEKVPKNRYAGAGALAEDLRRFLGPRRWSTPTNAKSSTATSSRPTSCWRRTVRPRSPTSAWPRSSTTRRAARRAAPSSARRATWPRSRPAASRSGRPPTSIRSAPSSTKRWWAGRPSRARPSSTPWNRCARRSRSRRRASSPRCRVIWRRFVLNVCRRFRRTATPAPAPWPKICGVSWLGNRSWPGRRPFGSGPGSGRGAIRWPPR